MKFLGRPVAYLTLACLSLLLLSIVPTASAGPVTMNITNANCGLSCGTVPANSVLGTISMNLNNNGSVTVTVLLNPAYTFIVPDGNDINFNLGNSNTGNVHVSSFFQSATSGGPFNIPLTFSGLTGPTNVGGGLGDYAVTVFKVQDPAKPQQPLDYLQFTLTNSSGAYSMEDLLNSSWAFHLGTCPQPTQGCNATTTGFVATGPGTPPTTVPEPGTATLAVLGTGLLCLSSFMRRRFNRLGAM